MERNKIIFASLLTASGVVIFAIAAIFGTNIMSDLLKVTGFGTTAVGTATVNITTEVAIVLTDANISFGNGTVTQGSPFAILNTCGQAQTNGTWIQVTDFFVVQNDGNVLANVSIKSANGKGFVGGSAAQQAYFFNYTDNEATSCLLAGGATPAGSYNGLSTADNVTCQKLNFSDTADEIKVCLRMQIPSDATPGLKTDQVTFTATQSA